MSVYEQAKTITALQAAERYAGVQPTGSGYRVKACCPIHREKTPSCTFYADGTFYCYGCHAGGTSIDLTAKLFGLTPYAAARKLCEDYGLTVPTGNATVKRDSRPPRNEIKNAISVFDSTVVSYVKALTRMLAQLTEDTEEQDKAREIILKQREAAQLLADELLEASQAQDDERIERLLVDNAEWIKGVRQDLYNAKKFKVLEVEDYE